MRRSLARFSGPESLVHTRSLADFITTTSGFRFSVCTGVLDLVAKRHRVIAFDRPGFGYSDRPHGSAWSAGTQADLIRDAFAVLGINRPIVLGHSWGAAVALALGLIHPDAVRELVLLSGYYYPTLRADVLFSTPTAIPILGDLLRFSVSPLIGRAMLPLLLKGMFAPLPVPARFTKSFPRGMSVRPGQIRAQSQDGVAMIPVALAMRHRYQELSMPIVIMAGTKDRVVKSRERLRKQGNQRRCSAALGKPPPLTRRPQHRWPPTQTSAR
jgi:pimeloyl-ACP methyl ester carboxylesterase